KEIVQVLFVRDLLHPEPGQEIVVKAPADVVVAAQVVLEGAVLGQTGQDVQLTAEQGGVGGGHRVPGGAHGGDIVQHMALWFVGGAKVGGDPGRLHHHFAQQQGAGADALADPPAHAHAGVRR